jgi:hypothetical protein
MGFYTGHHSERTEFVFDRLQDLGAARIADMDVAGVDRQVISLTSPVNRFGSGGGSGLSRSGSHGAGTERRGLVQGPAVTSARLSGARYYSRLFT